MNRMLFLFLALTSTVSAQKAPYDVYPSAEPPYYRVRYEASTTPGDLVYSVNYTVWVPPGVATLRGLIVHQHGCGEGSCKSGLTGAFDLHWQALAKAHDCALMAPAYEQPQEADCQKWCDPRNGSGAAFRKSLVDLGAMSGHPELASVPWALWGHSGGGHWAGGMVMLHPERVVAAWLRSGVPLLKAMPERPEIKTYSIPDGALGVPIMCNLGTKEGVTLKDGRFSKVWPANETFFTEMRAKGSPIGVAIDPLTSHECGNQRYLAIPWLNVCLALRLPKKATEPLKPIPTDGTWLAPLLGTTAEPAVGYSGEQTKAIWLPNKRIAEAWMHYVKDTAVPDNSAPPSPTNLQIKDNILTWDAEADIDSGLAHFIIERDGKLIATVPKEEPNHRFGRPVFQGLLYSDTPSLPLVEMRFTDTDAVVGKTHQYHVIAVNTVGLHSKYQSNP